jgi:Caspase domain
VKAALVDRIPQGCKCLIVLDSCYSGTAADLRYIWQAPTPSLLTYSESRNYPKTAGTVLALTSCLDTQVAADTRDDQGRPCGALTMALLRTWKTYGPAIKFKHLLWDVRTFLKQRSYSQIPQVSTGAPYDINASFDLSAL